MRNIIIAGVALALIGCGGDSGEPIEGTISIGYGDDTISPDVGAALRDPDSSTRMYVLIGTNGVDCGTDLETFNESGTFVFFDVDNTGPATHSDTSIDVIRSTSNNFSLNGGFGTVVIDTIGAERVTGSVTFSTPDEDVGMITVGGTFDVIRCF
jgi:hypothetical protein